MARKQAGRKAAARKGAPARRSAGTMRGSKARSAKRAAASRKSPASKRKAAGSRAKTARPSRKATPRKAGARKAVARKAASKAPNATKPAPVRQAAPAKPAPPSASRKRSSSARSRQTPSLERARRQLPELDDNIPTPPSSLDLDRTPSAARSGRAGAIVARSQHNETSPELTGGDVDADWEDAYAVGDEAPGGDNPTPDQDRVDDIGRALGVEYQDNEELKASEKISKRDKHRWELDPASAEDYNDRDVE
ncbi:MAG TPA: DUF6335 family protein [Vicinamibacterales bacterium]|nr:DUF6335 family protein [Vicinamibacterales bacterium]